MSTPSQLQSSVSTLHSSFNSKLQRLFIFCLGKYNFLNIKDLKYVFDRDVKSQQFKPSKQEEVYRSAIEKNVSTYLVVGAASSIAINLLFQKISPKFSNVTPGKLIIDLAISSLCFGTAMYLSLNAIEPDLAKLKQLYFQQKDQHFIRHLKYQGAIYNVSLQNQIKRFLNQNEFDRWNAYQGVQLLSLIQ